MCQQQLQFRVFIIQFMLNLFFCLFVLLQFHVESVQSVLNQRSLSCGYHVDIKVEVCRPPCPTEFTHHKVWALLHQKKKKPGKWKMDVWCPVFHTEACLWSCTLILTHSTESFPHINSNKCTTHKENISERHCADSYCLCAFISVCLCAHAHTIQSQCCWPAATISCVWQCVCPRDFIQADTRVTVLASYTKQLLVSYSKDKVYTYIRDVMFSI